MKNFQAKGLINIYFILLAITGIATLIGIDKLDKTVEVNCEVISYSKPYTKPQVTCRDMFSPKITVYDLKDHQFFIESRERGASHLTFESSVIPDKDVLFWTDLFGKVFLTLYVLGIGAVIANEVLPSKS